MNDVNTSKPVTINLALQGGGSHGAFTWGVLDRLLEEERIVVDGISGASAGAMNAVVYADGLLDGGVHGAKKALHDFWKAVSETPSIGALKIPSLMEFVGAEFDLMSRMFSPYQTNPLNINPLRDMLNAQIDFPRLRQKSPVKLFICATNVKSGRVKVFKNAELSCDVLLASSCLPFLFQAVEINGEHYWDGGYMGNPPIFPLYEQTETHDIMIVQINPIERNDVPDTSPEIIDRLNEISFNSPLILELRGIDFVNRMLAEDRVDTGKYKHIKIHAIDSENQMRKFGASSKSNSDWGFLQSLHKIGRHAADKWLAENLDAIGERSSVNIAQKFL
ncbi:patatin-like phospholipase family protein [Undibacterium arcticum]|uniref:Patatin-like phospholipase family protein n=1 Tax=Undibacterium arcticum TaxID=1762892 RepID=A0ABV7F9M7_9BURK